MYDIFNDVKENKMTPSELKYQVECAGTCEYFFTRRTMKFFGDTMKNYGCRSAGGCWELYRKRPVKHGLIASKFFDKKTFESVSK